MNKVRIALFASGKGSNALRIMEYFSQHDSIEVALLLSNKADAGALSHAKTCGVPHAYYSNADFREGNSILDCLAQHSVDVIVLAGFLLLIPTNIIHVFADKMINIHPSLLPKHGGKGMYGHFVHEAVERAGDSESGITIHLVNAEFDKGRIVAQFRVALEMNASAASIEAKVRKLEIEHYAPTIERWLADDFK